MPAVLLPVGIGTVIPATKGTASYLHGVINTPAGIGRKNDDGVFILGPNLGLVSGCRAHVSSAQSCTEINNIHMMWPINRNRYEVSFPRSLK